MTAGARLLRFGRSCFGGERDGVDAGRERARERSHRNQ